MAEDEKTCPSCREEIDDSEKICPYCDYKIPEGQTSACQTGYPIQPIASTPAIKPVKTKSNKKINEE